MNAHLEFGPTASYLARVAEPALRTLVVAGAAGVSLAALKISGTTARLAVWRGVLGVAVAMPLLSFLVPSIPVAVPLIDKSPVVSEALRPVLAPMFTGRFEHTQAAEMAQVRAGQQITEAPDRLARAARATRPFSHLDSNSVNALNATDALNVVSSDAHAHEATVAKTGLITRLVQRLTDRVKSEVTFTRTMAIVYLAGLVCLAARMLTGIVLGSRLAKQARTVRSRRAIEHLDRCSDALKLRESPRLAESAALTVPVTFGVLEPAVLLPADWTSWTDAQLDSVLLHELSHVARCDALAERVSLVHRAIFWFSPLSWWLDRELSKLAEQASDEAALASGIDREQYAETLLGFLTALQSAPGRVRWQGVSMAASGQAEKRMERILRWKGESEMTLKKSAVVAIVATFVPIVCLASAFTPRFEKIYLDQDAKAAPPAQSSARSNPSAPNAATPSSDASETGAKPAPAPHVIVVMPDSPPRITSDGVTSPHAIVVAPYAAVPAPRAYVYAVPPQQPGAPSVPVTVYAPPSVRLDAPVAIDVEPMPPMPPVSVDVKAMMKVNVEPFQEGSTTIIRTDDHADSYVIVSGKMSYSVIAGPENISIINDGDNSAAQELRGRYGDHFIWFRLNGKEYVITDPATVQKAMQSFDKMNELGKQQEELGRQQEVLGDQQSKLGELQSQQFANLPDVSKEMDQLNAELKQLNSPETKEAIAKAQANLDAAIAQLNANSPNMEETLAKLQAESEAMSQKISAESLAQIQEQLGEIQGKIGEAEALSGESAGKLGALQGQLGAKQGELGRKQGELGREQERASRDAQRQLRKLFQDAVANGTAKPQ
jgi:beta-lactamase regulating signal transducer with metallopeptidase domain